MEILILISIILLPIISLIILGTKKEMERLEARKKKIENKLSQIDEFSAIQKFIARDAYSAIAIDDHRNKLCLVDQRQKNNSVRVFSYKDILSSIILEDNIEVVKTVRSSQLGGVLIGGLALGGVGAIIGGLSAKSQSTSKVKRIDLCLTVNDTEKPLHTINFLYSEIAIEKETPYYKFLMEQARHWHGVIEVLIKRADTEDKTISTNNLSHIQPSSIADEINKLVELHRSGIIDDEEYQKLKSKIIN